MRPVESLSNTTSIIVSTNFMLIFFKPTDELVPLVGQDTITYLNRLRGLSNPMDIEIGISSARLMTIRSCEVRGQRRNDFTELINL